MMNKEQILSEIRRTAKANGGVALSRAPFFAETGIRREDWYGRFWIRWGDAIRDAGVRPNIRTEGYDDNYVLGKLVPLTRSLGCVPTEGDLKLARRNDSTFPSPMVFRRFGEKPQRASRVIAYCEKNPGNDDVARLWRPIASQQSPEAEEPGSRDPAVGCVYLLKHGASREYKIGRTNNPLRPASGRGYQLPEKLRHLHYIETDDPAGVENYWHMRFARKRKKNGWFALTAEDIRAFMRWKRIY